MINEMGFHSTLLRKCVGLLLLFFMFPALANAWEDPNRQYKLHERYWMQYSTDLDTLGLFHFGQAVDSVIGDMETPDDQGPSLLPGEMDKGTSEVDVQVEQETIVDSSSTSTSGRVLQPHTMGENEGYFGEGVRLKGKTAAIVTPTYSNIPKKGVFTVEAWIFPDKTPATLFWCPDAHNRTVLRLDVTKGNKLSLTYGDKNTVLDVTLQSKQWNHIALSATPAATRMRSDYGTSELSKAGFVARETGRFRPTPEAHGPQIQIILNGRIVARENIASLPALVKRMSGQIWVGNTRDNDKPLKGRIDELRISSIARRFYSAEAFYPLDAETTPPVTGQPYLRDKRDLLLTAPFEDSLRPATSQINARPDPYPDNKQARHLGGVVGRSGAAGPRIQSPAFRFPAELSARSGTVEFWFSPLNWDNGRLRPVPESRGQTKTLRGKPHKAPHRVAPLFGLCAGDPNDSDKKRWILTVAAHEMWSAPGRNTPAEPPLLPLHPGRWYHFVATIDHGHIEIYLNGQKLDGYLLQTTKKVAPANYHLSRMVFGHDFPWKHHRLSAGQSTTLFDEVRLYSRPLTPQEIHNTYARYRPDEQMRQLPFAHVGIELDPLYNRARTDVTLLAPDRGRVDHTNIILQNSEGETVAERRLPPLKNGRTWMTADDITVDTPRYTATWTFMDESGETVSSEQREKTTPEKVNKPPQKPPFGLQYFPGKESVRIEFRPVWHPASILSDHLTTSDGSPGLSAEYYDNMACRGKPITTRTDPQIAFQWKSSPANKVPEDFFGVVWKGQLGPVPYGGNYRLTMKSNGRAQVWIDGDKLIDADGEDTSHADIKLTQDSMRKLKVQYAAGTGEARCDLQWQLLHPPDSAAKETAEVQVISEDGKKLFHKKVEMGQWLDRLVHIGPVPSGEHTVEALMPGSRMFHRQWIKRKHFVFEGNRLGITDRVLAPFEPITIDGQQVNVVMRRYTMNGLGLWESLEARSNEGDFKELLAAPMKLIVNGDKPLKAEGKFVKKDNHEVVYESAARTPAITVSGRSIIEYDGCMRVELTLKPGTSEGEEKIDSLLLDIPLKNSRTPLWHLVKTRPIRHNPAGKTPEGEGRVWDSRQFGDRTLPGNFLPYIYLGAEERGLCWFADNDRGWIIDSENNDPCLTLDRDGDVLHLRVHLIQKTSRIQKNRKIVFGLMASPGKPMPDNWRNIMLRGGREWSRGISWAASTYWGGAEIMKETYPLDRDFSLVNKFQELRLGGSSGGEKFKKAWFRRHADYQQKGRKPLENIFGLGQHMMRMSRHADLQNAYWEEFRSVSWKHPETRIFRDEWWGDRHCGWGFRPGESYIDFQCWYGAEFIRRGIGLYFDNTAPKGASNPHLSTAYRDENGDIHNSARMWWHRRYLKRLWVMHQQLAPAETEPLMMFHMTNSHVVPYMTFGESNLDLEWRYGARPTQAKFSPALLRAESLGLQSGNIPLALADIKSRNSSPPPMQAKMASRTKSGVLWVHEIRFRNGSKGINNAIMDFGYGREDCEVYNYWDSKPALITSDPNCKWLVLKRNAKLLLLLCTWNKKQSTVEIEFNGETLGLNPSQAVDVEHPDADTVGDMMGDLDDLDDDNPNMEIEGSQPDKELVKDPAAWQGEIKFDGATGKLTVPLDGYGVRVIGLE